MTAPTRAPDPLLPPAGIEALRAALAPFTADGVAELLGPVGNAAHQRGDLAGVARAVRLAGDVGPVATFTRLFLLGADVAETDAAVAFAPLALEAAVAAGIVERSGERVRARLEIRPYAEASAGSAAATGDPWWVVSDLGSDVRPGPLARDHVLGIGNAALTLAQATPRAPVDRALDIGTGCGVQALHLARHAGRVTATDVSGRALRFAATTAALSGQTWHLRQGSFVEPVAGETFDLVVANPPFVISPGPGGSTGADYDYRDSGRPGDAACRDLVADMIALLRPGGTAQLLANWIVPVDGSWQERVAGWFPADATAWVWQREVADLGEYVTMWLRDAGLEPGSPGWAERYDPWLDWFAANSVAAVGMGLITARRNDPGERPNPEPVADVTCEDVPQPVAQPIGAEVAAWFDRRDLATAPSDVLLRAPLRPAAGLVRTRHDTLASDSVEAGDGSGWRTARSTLRQSHGMRWEIEVDETVAGIVAACAAGATPHLALEVLAATSGEDADDADDLADRFVPVLRDLVQRGVLVRDDAVTDGALTDDAVTDAP